MGKKPGSKRSMTVYTLTDRNSDVLSVCGSVEELFKAIKKEKVTDFDGKPTSLRLVYHTTAVALEDLKKELKIRDSINLVVLKNPFYGWHLRIARHRMRLPVIPVLMALSK
jgi:hypothetical protein